MIVFTSDHAGFGLKHALMARMEEIVSLTAPDESCIWFNVGPDTDERVDYPDSAHAACRIMADDPTATGVFICGTGIGMSIVANRYGHVRCAVATSVEMAEASRLHNDANAIALGARLIDEDTAVAILRTFLNTKYVSEERHDRRLAKINPEDKTCAPEPQSV